MTTPLPIVWSWLTPSDRAAMAVAALVGGAVAAWARDWAVAPDVGLLAALSLAVVMIDGRRFLIPDLITLPIGLLGLLDAALSQADVVARLVAMAAVALGLLALRAVFTRLRGQSALGLGDVKLMTAAALWLDVQTLPIYIFLAALSGLLVSLLKTPRGGRIAFGQHLAPWLVIFAAIDPILPNLSVVGGLQP